MKTAVLYGKEDVRLEQRPTPRPGPGEVLLKIKAALTCGTDLKVFRNGGHARMIKPPAPFGHEFAGVVEAAGPGVTSFKPGQRVVGANSAPCGACFFCRKGQPNLCEDLLFVNGAYAEYLLLPARLVRENLLEIPASLSFEAAALTEPLACVVRGAEAAKPAAGETVVILGAGPVGLMFLQLVRGTGAKVVLVGKGDSRLKAALACGAEAALDLDQLSDPVKAAQEKTPEKRGADLVIEAVGRPAAWSQALRIVRPGGRVLLFGGCPAGAEVPLDTRRMHYDELTLLSTFHHTPEAIRKSLSLLAKGVVRPEPLITRQAPLDDLPQILRRMLTQADGVKTAIIP
ncbi:MAG: alcohol dehydrogenase catalytic domain-containing protein [Candidatus Omnitrophica bacterium]|nr:alcohol dehydrogenase catalytic domain-containing protein [Candidatus Omnitrophota bacterium]